MKVLNFLYLNKITPVMFLLVILSVLFIAEANAQDRKTERRSEVRARVERRNLTKVQREPQRYESIIVGKKNYFYNGGFYYRRGPRGYVRIGAPLGARIRVLPVGYLTMRLGPLSYYYYNGIYYNYLPSDNVYVVVDKPAGIQTPADNNSKFDIIKMYDGTTVEGIFQGATDSTVTISVNGQLRDIYIGDIKTIKFAKSIQSDNGNN